MENGFLLRSMMFVPGHNDKLLESASRSEADALILDLEDSVMPAHNKSIARTKIKEYINSGKLSRFSIFPRVNDRESGMLLKDVQELTIKGIDGFVYPKSKKPEDIYFFDKLLETIEYDKEFPIGTFKIVALMETTSAIMNAQAIAESSKRLVALAFGCEDYITDLQGIHDSNGTSLFGARFMIANAARAAGIIPIDTVHIKVHDLEDLERNLQIAKNMGFEGMLALSPKELPLIHQYFSPSDEEIIKAKEMLELAKEAQSEDKGVTVLKGRFVGSPFVLASKKIIEKHEKIKFKVYKNK
ncbi:CoA ester lyase [Aminithiophilus ramosus]|uniref:CoA ester lyase n=1 Tax=Aminithiophilus ramosus TaxID=3029084 RepID=A0A9Q7ALJ6_9BACT|nr:CoA ester lyase [Aminithiophilus ramosus]QTX31897.1 CoA ester lyase [Aminithiophilus ramosus]